MEMTERLAVIPLSDHISRCSVAVQVQEELEEALQAAVVVARLGLVFSPQVAIRWADLRLPPLEQPESVGKELEVIFQPMVLVRNTAGRQVVGLRQAHRAMTEALRYTEEEGGEEAPDLVPWMQVMEGTQERIQQVVEEQLGRVAVLEPMGPTVTRYAVVKVEVAVILRVAAGMLALEGTAGRLEAEEEAAAARLLEAIIQAQAAMAVRVASTCGVHKCRFRVQPLMSR